MKKRIFLMVYILLSGVVLFAQPDSAELYNAVVTGGNIAQVLAPKPWIPGIANEVVSGIIAAIFSTVYGLFHRNKTIKRWKKEGKLND